MAHLDTSKSFGSLAQYLSAWNIKIRTDELGGGLGTSKTVEPKGVGH